MNYIIYSRTFIIIFIACCSEISKLQTISSIDASYTFLAVINSSNSLFAVTGPFPLHLDNHTQYSSFEYIIFILSCTNFFVFTYHVVQNHNFLVVHLQSIHIAQKSLLLLIIQLLVCLNYHSKFSIFCKNICLTIPASGSNMFCS